MKNDGGQAAGRAFDPTTTAMMPSEVVTRFVLLRHGEVESFGERVVRGQLDAALSEEGARQHERLVAWLREHEAAPDVIFSSDLSRCARLAALVGETFGVAPNWKKIRSPSLALTASLTALRNSGVTIFASGLWSQSPAASTFARARPFAPI